MTIAMHEDNSPDFVQISSSGRFVLLYSGPSGHADKGVVRVFEPQTLRLLWDAWAFQGEIDPSEKQVAILLSGSRGVEIRDASTGAVRNRIPGNMGGIAFAGSAVLAASREHDVAGIEIASGRVKWVVPVPDYVVGLRTAQEGRQLVLQLQRGETWIVRTADGKQICRHEEHGIPLPPALSQDGHTLALQDDKGTTLYDTESCQIVARGASCDAGSIFEDRTWLTVAVEPGGKRPRMVAWPIPRGDQIGALELEELPRVWHMAAGWLATAYAQPRAPFGVRLTVQPAQSLLAPTQMSCLTSP